MRRFAIAVAGMVVLTSLGCDDGGTGTRYRAERDFWRAQREARALDIHPELVGENELLDVADRYLRVGARYIGAVDPENPDAATPSDLSVARIGARAKLLAAQYYLRGGDYAQSKSVALDVRRQMSWSLPAEMNAQVALVEALRHEGTPEAFIAEMWRLAETYPAADSTGAEVHNAVFNAPRGVVRYVAQTGGDVAEAVERAIGYYENVGERWPGSVAALLADLHRSTLYDGRGDWELASRILENVLDTYPASVLVPDQAARVAYTLGRVLMVDARDPARAVAAFERARVAAPGTGPSWDATMELATHHAERGRYERAVELFREVAGEDDSSERSAMAMFAAGRVLERADRWDEARRQYNLLEVTHPGSEQAKRVPFVVAAHFRDVGEEELAESILERTERELRRTIREDHDTQDIVDAYAYLFDALTAREEWATAVAEMETFAGRFTQREEAAIALLRAAQIAAEKLGDSARAGALLQRVETEYPNTGYAEQAAAMIPELVN